MKQSKSLPLWVKETEKMESADSGHQKVRAHEVHASAMTSKEEKHTL